MNLYNRSLTATVRLEYLNNFLGSVLTGCVYKSEPRYSGELLLLNCDRNSGPRPRHLCGYPCDIATRRTANTRQINPACRRRHTPSDRQHGQIFFCILLL